MKVLRQRQANLRELQACPSPGDRVRGLQQPTAQATAGLKR